MKKILIFVTVFLFLSTFGWTEEIEMIEVSVEDEGTSFIGEVEEEATGVGVVQGPWSANPFDQVARAHAQDSFETMARMQEKMFRMSDRFHHLFGRGAQIGDNSFLVQENSSYSYEESDQNIILSIQVPDVVDSTLEIEIKNDRVSVQGMKETELEESGKSGYSYYSSSQSSFYQEFPLHSGADPKQYIVEIKENEIVITFDKGEKNDRRFI